MKLNRSGEDYLKAILALKQEKDKVRSSDIAKCLSVTRPSVSNAVRSLKEGGFLMMDENKNIFLTEHGLKAAKQVYERHRVIKETLVFIGVEPGIAEQDACRIEHDMSRQSFEILKKLWEKYKMMADSHESRSPEPQAFLCDSLLTSSGCGV